MIFINMTKNNRPAFPHLQFETIHSEQEVVLHPKKANRLSWLIVLLSWTGSQAKREVNVTYVTA